MRLLDFVAAFRIDIEKTNSQGFQIFLSVEAIYTNIYDQPTILTKPNQLKKICENIHQKPRRSLVESKPVSSQK